VTSELRILHLEDDPYDARLIHDTLRSAGVRAQMTLAPNRKAFVEALERSGRTFDLVLADYKLPAFDGMQALAMVRACFPGLPFIFVTGALGEEKAVETLKSGATDFILKSSNGRLAAAVNRAMSEADGQRRRRLAEEELFATQRRLEAVLQAAPVGITFSDDVNCTRIHGNRAALAQFGATCEDHLPASAGDPSVLGRQIRFLQDDRELADHELPLQRAIHGNCEVPPMDLSVTLPGGRTWYCQASAAPLRDPEGRVIGGVALTVDVTEQKRAAAALQRSRDRQYLLSRTVSALLTSPDPQTVIDALCEEVRTYLHCDIFLNFLADRRTARLKLNACGGVDPEAARRMETLALDQTFCGSAVLGGSRMIIEHLQQLDDPRSAFAKSLGIRAYACIPLLGVQAEPIGTLSFGSRMRDTFEEDDLEVMQDVADHVAVALRRRHAEEALRRTAEELARSNKELEQFAYVASHDLQEPLRMVTAFVGLLNQQQRGKLDRDAQEYMGYIVEGAERMQRLIQDLLEYSRSGARAPCRDRVDAREAFETALSALRLAVTESGARITCDELPTVRGDGAQLALVFQNLIGNAIKFRRSAPEIHVAASRRGKGWVISVSDNGIGIETEHAAKVFEIFQRLHPRKKFPGTGMGLAICKKIVEGHGGRIWVESEPGVGSTFCFTLPDASIEPSDEQETANAMLETQ
jgi:PAS domain S-box-containing protein